MTNTEYRNGEEIHKDFKDLKKIVNQMYEWVNDMKYSKFNVKHYNIYRK